MPFPQLNRPARHARRSRRGLTDLGTFGGLDSTTYLINEAGTVAGQARMTPVAAVPAPAPFTMLALGIAETALARRRRARRDLS